MPAVVNAFNLGKVKVVNMVVHKRMVNVPKTHPTPAVAAIDAVRDQPHPPSACSSQALTYQMSSPLLGMSVLSV